MGKTESVRTLERAEQLHADDPERADMIARARRFKAGWYELAEALTETRRRERFKAWGFQSFEDYCRRELHLKPDTVAKLTGSFAFLRKRAPEVLARDGRTAPIPSYQAVDFWRRAEEEQLAPAETIEEIRTRVLDEAAPASALSRAYRTVVFPVDDGEEERRRRAALRSTAGKLLDLLGPAREEGMVPRPLADELEEPLARLRDLLEPSADKSSSNN
jgi:hypothetical protein